MAKTKQKDKSDRIPPDVLEAVEEAAADLAAETNLTKAEARDKILARLNAKADAADVTEAADDIEDEEDSEDTEDKSKSKSKSKSKRKRDEESEDSEDEEDSEEEEEEEEEEEDENDEKPPPSHWSSRPLFGGKR